MARPQVADGGTACNMEGSCEYIEERSRTADKGLSSSLGLNEVLTTPHGRNWPCYERVTCASGLD